MKIINIQSSVQILEQEQTSQDQEASNAAAASAALLVQELSQAANTAFENAFSNPFTHHEFLMKEKADNLVLANPKADPAPVHHSACVSGILLAGAAIDNNLANGNLVIAAQAGLAQTLAEMQTNVSDTQAAQLQTDNQKLLADVASKQDQSVINADMNTYQMHSTWFQAVLTQMQSNSDSANTTVQNMTASQKSEYDEAQSVYSVYQVSQQALA